MEKGGRGERQGREKGEEAGDPEKLKKRRGTREEQDKQETWCFDDQGKLGDGTSPPVLTVRNNKN